MGLHRSPPDAVWRCALADTRARACVREQTNQLQSRDKQTVKITDFGLSTFFKPGEMNKSSAGSLCYLPPEVLRGESNAGPPIDVWSLGVIMYALLVSPHSPGGAALLAAKHPTQARVPSVAHSTVCNSLVPCPSKPMAGMQMKRSIASGSAFYAATTPFPPKCPSLSRREVSGCRSLCSQQPAS